MGAININASDLTDDNKSYAGVSVEKPWGGEEELHLTSDCSVWRLWIELGHETSMHCHPQKNTVLIVEMGEIELWTLNGMNRLCAGQSALIEKGVFHRIKSGFGARVLELEWPPNRRDLVRLEDRYGRGQGY